MIGLYHDLVMLRTQLASKRVTAAAVDSDPHIAHDSGVSVIRMESEEREMVNYIAGAERYVAEIQGMMNRMLAGGVARTPHRTLVIRHLEDAQSRLLRELGDKP